MENKILCGIECGGTTHRVVFARDNHNRVLSSHKFDTKDPVQLWKQIAELIVRFEATDICIASFGPVILRGAKIGHVISYTKSGWENFNIFDFVKRTTKIIPHIIHDCEAGALAELTWKGNNQKGRILYITIGTGVGMGLVENGKIVSCNASREAGHSFIKIKDDDNFKGSCKVHRDCLEGMASATAMAKRLNLSDIRQLKNIDKHQEVFEISGYYIGMFAYNMFLTLLPDVIVLGGGISHNKKFVESVKCNFRMLNNNYVGKEYGFKEVIIKTNAYGNDQGAMGCLYYLTTFEAVSKR